MTLLRLICVNIVVLGTFTYSVMGQAQNPDTSGDESTTRGTRMTAQEAAELVRQMQQSEEEQTVRELHQKLRLRERELREAQQELQEMRKELEELRIESKALRMALDTLRDKPIVVEVRNVQGPAVPQAPVEQGNVGQGQPAEEVAPDVPVADKDKPRWTTQYSLGLIEQGGGVRIVRRGDDGSVFIRESPDVDSDHVIIRGNFKNESARAYRYTFDIRIAGKPSGYSRQAAVIGEWRYQTTLLSPGEIHQFEVKVPVTHVANVHTYAIGNVVADQPVADKQVVEQPKDRN